MGDPDMDRGDDGRNVWHPRSGPVTPHDAELKRRYDAIHGGCLLSLFFGLLSLLTRRNTRV